MELTIDFDAPDEAKHRKGNIEHMQSALDYLISRFGKECILMRKSSSGLGWHIRIITGEDISPETELAIRQMLHDCWGRCIADSARLEAGLKTSRLFDIKSTSTKDDVEIVEAREWNAYP